MAESCKDCRFLKLVTEHGGQCCRYPPRVNTYQHPEGSTEWSNDLPYVDLGFWCGEWLAPTEDNGDGG